MRMQEVYDAIPDEGCIANVDIRARTLLSPCSVTSALKALRDRGLIENVGSGHRWARWRRRKGPGYVVESLRGKMPGSRVGTRLLLVQRAPKRKPPPGLEAVHELHSLLDGWGK